MADAVIEGSTYAAKKDTEKEVEEMISLKSEGTPAGTEGKEGAEAVESSLPADDIAEDIDEEEELIKNIQ